MKPPYALTLAIGLLTANALKAQNPVLSGTCAGTPMTVSDTWNAYRIEFIRDYTIGEKVNELYFAPSQVIAGEDNVGLTDNTHMYFPWKVVVGPNRDLYVTERHGGRVVKWSLPYSSCTVLASGLDWGDDMVLEPSGFILASEHWGKRIARWPGNMEVISMPGGAEGMCWDPTGMFLYTVDYWNAKVTRHIMLAGMILNSTDVIGNGTGSGLSQLNFPSDVNTDNLGRIYVLDESNNRIMRYPMTTFPGMNGEVLATGLGRIGSFSVDGPGNVYFTAGGGIYMIGTWDGVPRLVSGESVGGMQVLDNGEAYFIGRHCLRKSVLNPPVNWHVPQQAGTYIARVYYKDGTVKLTNSINVRWSPPSPVVSYNTPLCPGNTLSLSASGASAGSSYRWEGPGGFIALSANATRPGATAAYNGNYTAYYTEPDGCVSNVATLPVAISQPVPAVSITADLHPYFCPGASITFTASPTNGGTAPAYQWKKNGVDIGTGQTFSTAAVSNGDIITCVMTSNAPCASPATATSNAIALTAISITIASNSAGPVCAGTAPTFTATATGTASPVYQWKLNGTDVGSNSAAYTPATLQDGDEITCTLTSMAGCLASNPLVSNSLKPAVYGANDTILHVNEQVTGGRQNGRSWNDAFAELADALRTAAFCSNIREIWIAGGTYRPRYDATGSVPANTRAASLHIPSGVRIYGGLHTGYSSTNTTDLTTIHGRNYAIAATDTSYLDGTLPGGNAYHVVSLQNTTVGTSLHGLVIRNGNANGDPGPLDNVGAGLFARDAKATITHCAFRNNSAWVGGGIYQRDGSNIRYEHCRFEHNTATDYGAASSGINNAPAPAFTTFDHCLFAGNTAGLHGGGLNGVGYISVSMTNSLLYNNHANNGGGAWVFNTNQVGSFVINNTFYNNTAGAGNASTIQHNSGAVNFHNNIVMGTGTAITNTGDFIQTNSATPARTPANESWWFQSVTPGQPAFLQLTNCSPAINAGNNAAYGANPAVASDFAGNLRLQQGTIDQGAFESNAIPLTITLQPVPAIVCTPVDTSFSVLAASNAAITYQWQVDKNDGSGFTNIGGANNPTYLVTQPATTQNGWRYRAYASHCPFAADTTAAVPLTVNALPAMQPITGPLQLCEGKTTQLANTTAAASHSWKSLDAATATISTTGSVQGIQPGTVIMRYIATTTAGCIDSISSTVTVHALPVVQPITGMQRLCANSSLLLANATAGVTGYWRSTNPLAAQVDAATGRLTGVGAGTTTIRYIATNANGCQDSVAALINVDALPPVQPIVSATNDFKLCEQATLQLNNTTTANSSSWKILDNSIAAITTGGQVSGLLAGTTTARFIAVGINGTGCTDSTDKSITILPLQPTTIDISASTTEICDGTEVIFTARSTNGGNSPAYQWMLNNQPTGHSGTWRSHTLKEGDIISCVLQSNAACASPAILPSGTIAMTVHPLPVVNPHSNKGAIYKGDQLFLQAGISSDVTHIKWSPATGLSNDTIAAPLARPMVTTMYEVAATTQYGCTVTGRLEITVLEPQDIPNAFSPNGDGINDRWEIRSLEKFPQATIQIFNRYGQPLYKANGYQPGKGWDGRLNGQPLPMGTYYYIIDLKNELEPLSGSISIIK